MNKKEFRQWIENSINNHGTLPPNFDFALSKLIKIETKKSFLIMENNIETVYKNANNITLKTFKRWFNNLMNY